MNALIIGCGRIGTSLARKSKEIFETKKAAICFYWKSMNRQVRVVGEIKKIPGEFKPKKFIKFISSIFTLIHHKN